MIVTKPLPGNGRFCSHYLAMLVVYLLMSRSLPSNRSRYYIILKCLSLLHVFVLRMLTICKDHECWPVKLGLLEEAELKIHFAKRCVLSRLSPDY